MNSRRNRIRFDFFSILIFVTNPKGSIDLILSKNLGYVTRNLHPPRPFISVFHTITSFHPFSSIHVSSDPFPRTFSSLIFLRDTCQRGVYFIKHTLKKIFSLSPPRHTNLYVPLSPPMQFRTLYYSLPPLHLVFWSLEPHPTLSRSHESLTTSTPLFTYFPLVLVGG